MKKEEMKSNRSDLSKKVVEFTNDALLALRQICDMIVTTLVAAVKNHVSPQRWARTHEGLRHG